MPSSVGVAVVAIRAGSDPTSGSVSRNAEIAPAAQRGQEPLLLLGGADQLDRLRDADRLVRRQQRAEAGCTEPTSISARP